MFHHMVLMEFTVDANRAFHDRVEAYADQIRRLAYVKRYVFRRNLEMKAYMTPFISRIIACDVDEEQA